MKDRVVVTGAFSYTGAAVAAELLRRGFSVHTLTNRRTPEGARISSSPLRFDPAYLCAELAGARAFVNTYWVRLPYAGQSFDMAVANSKILIDAAASAGVKRLIQISVSNADEGKNLGYYTGKARVDAYVRQGRVPFSIVRPTLVVGPADVLTNNIAWFLRRFPAFMIPGNSPCRLQPVTLDDTARIICDSLESPGNSEIDAAGPDIMDFSQYVGLVAKDCGVKKPIFRAPEGLSLAFLKLAGFPLQDIVLTREEFLGLKQELLTSRKPPLGKESVARWLELHGAQLGREYMNDLDRHFGQGKTHPVLSPDPSGDLHPFLR